MDASLPADFGFDVAWDTRGLLRLLEEWRHPMLNRRDFLAVSGLALTAPAWRALDLPPPASAAETAGATRVNEPLLTLVEDIVARAQQLDDTQGGAAADFVAGQYANVARLLREGHYGAPAGRRLAASAAQLAQTAGFMAYDSADDGLAQRWYFAGIRAAHAAGDRGITASILGLMSNQAVELGQLDDAAQLASAAMEAAQHEPPIVRALLTARGSLAHAALGDLTAFRRAHDAGRTLLDRHTAQGEPTPRWAGYVTATELDAIAGRGLVMLAERVPARSSRLLEEAENRLRARAGTGDREVAQRSALRHGAWLALAHARSGDLDQSIAAGRQALTRVPGVASHRSVQLLRRLRTHLAEPAVRTPAATQFLAELDTQLSSGSARIPHRG